MTLEIYSASAGTGKTTKLAELMEDALLGRGVARCRPEGVIATTFTRQAAAELRERTRTQLLSNGHIASAHALHAAMIGTVNSVCGRIVSDFALDLGLSPELRVLDENEAAHALARCLSTNEHAAESREILKLARSLEALNDQNSALHWQTGVRQIVQLARLNGLDARGIEQSCKKSIESLMSLLGAPGADGAALDKELHETLQAFVRDVDPAVHTQQNTAKALKTAQSALSGMEHGGRPAWSAWVALANLEPSAKLREVALPVREAAAMHDRHPELRRELARAVELIFTIAARAMDDYHRYKLTRGVIDYVDQEVLALQALEIPDLCKEFQQRLDIVMVDEFQDTSPLQLAIFLKLFELAPRSIWVGDQKQAIYSFRGTDPALMSATIEQLEDTGSDGNAEFVERALADATRRAKVFILEHSWRSRPPLVDLTSDLFARAFAPHDIPPERTKITAGNPQDDPALGPCLEYWSLSIENNARTTELPEALANGVQIALADRSIRIRDRLSGKPRALRPEDIGVLCRTNANCRNLAAALGALGIAVQMPRTGLLATLEAGAVVAGLNLWRAPSAPLFKARLSRLLGKQADPEAWTNAALDAPYAEAFDEDPVIVALQKARAAHPDEVDPVTAIDLVMEAIGIRERCLAWGNAAQRLANLDVLRSHATAYVQSMSACGEACTVAGLLYHLHETAENKQDACALLDQEGAVAITTWHAAKGLEWPMVVLFGLEEKAGRPTRFFGARAETPPGSINLQAPLAGRWIRYWCTPYLGANTKTPFYERIAAHPLSVNADLQQDREELRLLYVGWTRAKDRLVLACHDHKDKFVAGMHRHLHDPAGPLVSLPTGPEVNWGGREIEIAYRELQIAEPETTAPEAGEGYDMPPRPRGAHVPARAQPSARQGVQTVREVHVLGESMALKEGRVDARALGLAMHAFLAADSPDHTAQTRQVMADELLQAWAVGSNIGPEYLLELSTRLRTWARERWQIKAWMPEVSMHYRDARGTRTGGRADLVLELQDGGWVLIDHKSFTRTLEEAKEAAQAYAGQLAAYSDTILAATRKPVRAAYIHVPLAGVLLHMA